MFKIIKVLELCNELKIPYKISSNTEKKEFEINVFFEEEVFKINQFSSESDIFEIINVFEKLKQDKKNNDFYRF